MAYAARAARRGREPEALAARESPEGHALDRRLAVAVTGRAAAAFHPIAHRLPLSMRFAVYLGYVAGFLTVASFIPQVVRVWRTKQTDALSIGTFALIITSGVAWITYGVVKRDSPVIVTNAGMVLLNCAILGAKLRYG